MARWTANAALAVFVALASAARSDAFTISVKQEGKAVALAHAILEDKTQVPKLVRLAFHGCFGDGCNGCINLDDPHNAGLEEIVRRLDEKYDMLHAVVDDERIMSRADFWALAQVEAVRDAARTVDVLHHRYGRVDCPTSPRSDAMHAFPDPHLGMEENLAKFGPESQFGLTRQETIALIGGGHSVGRVHAQFSGFGAGPDGSAPWDRTEDVLDNDIFKVLTSFAWKQERMGRGDYAWVPLVQDGAQQPTLLMLNTDMALLNIVPIANRTTGLVEGECGTEYEDCPFDVLNTPITVDFARDGEAFLAAFMRAFEKVIENGSRGLEPAKLIHLMGAAQQRPDSPPPKALDAGSASTAKRSGVSGSRLSGLLGVLAAAVFGGLGGHAIGSRLARRSHVVNDMPNLKYSPVDQVQGV